jgi:dCMP deaminase
MSDWDQKFMSLAQHIGTWSKDRGRKIGAVIVGPDNEIRATGFNGIPRGVRDDVEERHDRETKEKYIWGAHAERNSIYNAARIGVALKGCRIYSTLFPCIDCVIAIIQSGIVELITTPPALDDPQWGEGWKRGLIMLQEATITVRFVEKEF